MSLEIHQYFFRQLLRIRTFEERVGELFVRGGTAGSMLHLSIGEESGAVGVGEAMQPGDSFTTHHRGHGIFLARGADPKRMMAEIGGKQAGYCRGKGGSMHIADMGLGHLGANAIVGGGITHVVGAGLSYRNLKTGAVSVAFFGDGAMQQGGFYESMNLTALWKLPVLFVCINNEYGMGTRLDRASASLEFVKRAESFGLVASEVDGLDAEAVHATALELLAQARQGQPAFLKVNCYRFHGHARMDKSPYRDDAEEQAGRQKDTLAFQRKRLLDAGLSESDCDQIVAAVNAEMDEALQFALDSPAPPLDTIYEDVYAPGQPQPEPVDQRLRDAMHSPVLAARA